MRSPLDRFAVALAFAFLCLGAGEGRAQMPGSAESPFGPRPGEGGSPGGGADTPLRGGLGPGFSRAPSSVTHPGASPLIPSPPPLSRAHEAPGFELPLYGRLDLPVGAEDEGPPEGLTLDQAIDRLVHANLDLQSKSLEIPQAEADVLTAGLRANPILYYDTQLIPYGNFSEDRPGGATQYDLNVTLPLDLNGKRRLRAEVAGRAKRVIEAQYQDAVRLKIADLCAAYVDVLAARETVRYARASIEGLDRIVEAARSRERGGEGMKADVERIEIQREAAQLGLAEAEESLREARRSLAPLLNHPANRAEALELRGTIGQRGPSLPPPDALIRLALASRPDLASFRLGIQYAEADVRLAKRERFQDVYLLVQPYTFQDNAPVNAKSAHSWGMGMTIPLPIFDRNQGRIRRAEINVRQTRVDLETLEQQVAAEVRQAERRYQVAKASAECIGRDLIPKSARIRDAALKRFRGGEADIVDFLNAQGEYNDLVRQYRDTLVRHRRSMLDLNTALGYRLLP